MRYAVDRQRSRYTEGAGEPAHAALRIERIDATTPDVIRCESMRLVEDIRRRARAITGPILAISLIFYFGYHLFAGDRGFLAWIALSKELRDAKATLADLDAQRAVLERRVSLLRPDHLDPDLLDERARAVLNLAAPDEIVIPREPAPATGPR